MEQCDCERTCADTGDGRCERLGGPPDAFAEGLAGKDGGVERRGEQSAGVAQLEADGTRCNHGMPRRPLMLARAALGLCSHVRNCGSTGNVMQVTRFASEIVTDSAKVANKQTEF